jgi:hypothetical protein
VNAAIFGYLMSGEVAIGRKGGFDKMTQTPIEPLTIFRISNSIKRLK